MHSCGNQRHRGTSPFFMVVFKHVDGCSINTYVGNNMSAK